MTTNITDGTDPGVPEGYGSGRAIVLDGSGDYVAIPNDPAINTGTTYDTRTIELWFKAVDVNSSTEQVLYEEGDGSNGFNLYLKDGTLYTGAWSDGTGWNGRWTSFSSVESGTWYHIALVFNSADNSMYGALNGRDFTYLAPVSNMAKHEGDIAIGGSRNGTKFKGAGSVTGNGRYLEGRIDQVRLWSTALSAEVLQERARRTIDPSSSAAEDLILSYRFNKTTGTTVPDLGTGDGAEQNGTLEGDAGWTAYSGAKLGQRSTIITPNESNGTLGPSGGSVTVENVFGNVAFLLYQFGDLDGSLIESSVPGEDFSNVNSNRRLHMVWGIDAAGSFADVTFDFSSASGINDASSVRLLRRDGPGRPWSDVTNSWALDATAQTFSKTAILSHAQYAVAGDMQSLPVELASFRSTTTAEAVRLTWRTASEQNNAGFRVQRRTASGSWEKIGSVDGAGTTTETHRYRFEDAHPPYEADALHYRLKQVDTGGTVHLSDPITVERGIDAVQLKKTYPNPAREQVTVKYAVPDAVNGPARLSLYDVMGRSVHTVTEGSTTGRQKTSLDVRGLSSGVYFLRLKAGDTIKTRRLTVVR